MLEKYYYDFHIHSCLSPCADDDMTPNNIAGMATLKGLHVLALTDHNSCKNCPSFFKACKKQGIIPIAGAEVTTAEDIHAVCLFPTLEAAMEFDAALESYKIPFKNDEEVFGSQLIMDEEDNVTGHEEMLLVNATSLDIDSLWDFAHGFDALVYPAHIDREANGIVSVLGTLPKTPEFTAFEFHFADRVDEYKARFELLSDKPIVISSDAHFLWDINEAENFIEIFSDTYSSSLIRDKIFSYLRGDNI